MRLRTWPILVAGFGALVALLGLSLVESARRAQRVADTLAASYAMERQVDRLLGDINSGLYFSGLLLRDFLLDPTHITGDMYREQLKQTRESMARQLHGLRGQLSQEEQETLRQLEQEVDSYWDTIDPIFDWTPQQKLGFASLFLRQQVLPRREAVTKMAARVAELSAQQLRRQEQRIQRNVSESRRTWTRLVVVSVILGLVISILSVGSIVRLERRAEHQRERTKVAEQELRRLSQQLVHAQEDERRVLSRELHDAVGQALTALRVELGNLEAARGEDESRFRSRIQEAKALAEQTMRTVRDLSMGLRPSMLDDLGLGPALEWQAREFSRRTGTPVEVVLEGLGADLPESYRTCAYRVVQEALTNCARHAQAKHIRVAVHANTLTLLLAVEDDGVGLPHLRDQNGSEPGQRGLGLIGIEERARELGGELSIHSQPGKGTLLRIELPLPKESAA